MTNWVNENTSPGFSGIIKREKLSKTPRRSQFRYAGCHYMDKACQWAKPAQRKVEIRKERRKFDTRSSLHHFSLWLELDLLLNFSNTWASKLPFWNSKLGWASVLTTESHMINTHRSAWTNASVGRKRQYHASPTVLALPIYSVLIFYGISF